MSRAIYYQHGAPSQYGFHVVPDLLNRKEVMRWNPMTPKHWGRGWRKFQVNKSPRKPNILKAYR